MSSKKTYENSQGFTNAIFVAMFLGALAIVTVAPFVYRPTQHDIRRHGHEKITPETRLWFGMLTAPLIPISLFWMGCSPIIAPFFFGYGTISIFIMKYLQIMDSYEMYSAPTLTLVALIRCLAAGGMTVAGIFLYDTIGVPYTCTILDCVAVVMMPAPYLLYQYGHIIRAKGKFAVTGSSH